MCDWTSEEYKIWRKKYDHGYEAVIKPEIEPNQSVRFAAQFGNGETKHFRTPEAAMQYMDLQDEARGIQIRMNEIR